MKSYLVIFVIIVSLLQGCATVYYDAVTDKSWHQQDAFKPSTKNKIKIDSEGCCKGDYYIEVYMVNNKKPEILGTDVLYVDERNYKIVYKVVELKKNFDNTVYVAFDFNPKKGIAYSLVNGKDGRFYLSNNSGSNIEARVFGYHKLYELYQEMGFSLLDKDSMYMDKSTPGAIYSLAEAPKPIFTVAPLYSSYAGKVILKYDLTLDGVPVNVEVITSPSDDLKFNSIDTLLNWRFQKTIVNGVPVERKDLLWEMNYEVNYRMNVKVI